jgi:hypothetical protein
LRRNASQRQFRTHHERQLALQQMQDNAHTHTVIRNNYHNQKREYEDTSNHMMVSNNPLKKSFIDEVKQEEYGVTSSSTTESFKNRLQQNRMTIQKNNDNTFL